MDDEIKKWLGIYLIRAKVELEYGMGFSKNIYLEECKKDINSALKLLVKENDNDDTK